MEKGVFSGYTGQDTEVTLPQYTADNQSLTTIGSKAFLSCKTVEKLVLPPTVETVMDWGFAHMKNLREIVMPDREIRFGRQVFLGCESLSKVTLYQVKKWTESADIYILGQIEGLDGLRASMFRFFPQAVDNLFWENGTLEQQCNWLSVYDEALTDYLDKPDDEGFVPAFIGWFDVEDVDDQKQDYLVKVRKDKIGLVFQRLNCPKEPCEEHLLTLYGLLNKRPLLVKEFLEENPVQKENITYYKIWRQAGGLDRDMAEILLGEAGPKEPEIRGFLMELIKPVDEDDFWNRLEI